jgi:hypothetical protein
MKTIVIYDDTVRKSEVIEDIIGDKGFADVVVKRRHLEEYYRDEIQKIYPNVIWKKIQYLLEFADLIKELEIYSDNQVKIIHCFSNYLISDREKASLSFKKLAYVDEPFGVLNDKRAAAAMFPNVATYINFCMTVMSGQKAWDVVRNMKDTFDIQGLVDIGIIGNFIQCITGNFDSRYYNVLEGNEYILIKSSSNINKIKAEYSFYHLLPEDMKFWFVMPFNYRESDDSANYTMERLHMTDLAVKWVHGSMDECEFEGLMDKYFFFFKSRHVKSCSDQQYRDIANALYIDKVKSRVSGFKQRNEYEKIKTFLETSEDLDIDKLVEKYLYLKGKVEDKVNYPKEIVIGHGDPCFANALYNKSTKTLKFIDPVGALSEEELWTNPYYDIAKLSHSVCGGYDFFNNGIFDIKIGPSLSLCLEIPFDNSDFIKIFKRKVEENGFNYLSVRIYEASLFLSMLPLHIDNPHKVMGFILNARNILEEIEKDV